VYRQLNRSIENAKLTFHSITKKI